MSRYVGIRLDHIVGPILFLHQGVLLSNLRRGGYAAALTVLVSVALTGCFSSKSETTETTPAVPIASDSAQPTTAAPEDPQETEPLAPVAGALDAYVAAEAAAIPQLMDIFGEVYSEIRIEAVEPHTVRYTYVYLSFIDPDEANAYFDSIEDQLTEQTRASVLPAMSTAGVRPDQAVEYVYVNSDGATLRTLTVTSE